MCVFSHAGMVNTFAIMVDATYLRFDIKLFRGHCSTAKLRSLGRLIQLTQINDEFRPHMPALGANDILVLLCGQSVHKQMHSLE